MRESLDGLLKKVTRTRKNAEDDGKSAYWKVAVAAVLKEQTTVTHRWLQDNLAIGSLDRISQQIETAAWRAIPIENVQENYNLQSLTPSNEITGHRQGPAGCSLKKVSSFSSAISNSASLKALYL